MTPTLGSPWNTVPQFLTLAFLLLFSLARGEELPAGATTVYRGVADVPGYTALYFRSSDGTHWRWLSRDTDGTVETKTSYTSLGNFRNVLLTIDDRAGIMGAALWDKDSDGDGYSDMLEYLTNGDPYNVDSYPTEPRILYFDGGQSFETLLPLPDMKDGNGEDSSEVTAPELEELVRTGICVLSFMSGLFLWRLAILAMSRRNIL